MVDFIPKNDGPRRKEWVSKFTTVRHFARPKGPSRENGPHLDDLRAFVEACEGLPDDTLVYINKDSSTEGGRYNVEFSVRVEVRQVEEEQ